MPNWLPQTLIGIVVVVFNAGGVFYLAQNHFAHVNVKLDQLDERLRVVEQGVAAVKVALHLPGSLTEH